MEFKRNAKFDDLIIKVKENENIIDILDYEELDSFISYLEDMKDYLLEKKRG